MGAHVLAEVLAAPIRQVRVPPDAEALPALRLVPPPTTQASIPKIHWFAKLAIAGAGAVAIAALVASVLVGREVSRMGAEMRDQRVQQAWANLKQRIGGNTGKAADLSYLWASGQPLDGVNLSCKRIGDFDSASAKCVAAPQFNRLSMDYDRRERPDYSDLPSASLLDGPGIRSLDLSEAKIRQASISGMWFTRSKFDGTKVFDSVLAGTRMEGSFRAMRITDSVLTGSWIEGDIWKMKIKNSDVSGLTFVGLDASNPTVDLRSNWAWADMPPSMFSGESHHDDGELHALPEDVLKSVRLCMPPLTPSGTVIPVERRRYASDQNRDCQTMSVIASQYLFPKTYGVTDAPMSWSERQAAALAELLKR